MRKFSVKEKNLEVRSCNDFLCQDGEHTRAEIVAFNDDGSVYTVALWEKLGEGYDLRFVGDRPFELDYKEFMSVAKIGQELLK